MNKKIKENLFSEYYKTMEIDIPSIEKREFGIGIDKKIDARHLSFKSKEDLRNYLVSTPPNFISHSTGYYQFPSITPIEKKVWMGADVVFDLDIHSETKYGVYQKLESIKEDAIRLVEDFLVSDFGISKKDIVYVFSGNRGYHIHTRNNDYLNLRSDGRREIVDYIMGSGLNYNNFFDEQEIKRGVVKLTGPTPDEGGYRGRFARETIRLLHEDPSVIARKFNDSAERDKFIEGINEGNWSRTSVKDIKNRLSVVADRLSVSCVNTDAGVTQDLSKLIRVPNTIHGDTGLVAKKVEKMDSFYPLKDAAVGWKGEKTVTFTEDVPELEFDSTYGPFKNKETKSLPASIAVFFALRRSATLSP